jgi:hypothetical protein
MVHKMGDTFKCCIIDYSKSAEIDELLLKAVVLRMLKGYLQNQITAAV